MNTGADTWPQDWLVPDWPAPPGVRSVCTTRTGGASAAPWGSMNLGDHVGDDLAAVQSNRSRLAACLQATPVFLQQVHGTAVACLEQADSAGPRVADASTTRVPGIACTVMVADCLPVLLADTRGLAVAAAHAGWRGLAGEGGRGVIEAALAALGPDSARHNLAWLGPCIGPRAFEVGDDVRQAFVATSAEAGTMFEPAGQPGKWWCNLAGLARQRLQALGVERVYGNDGTDAWCTVRNPSRFFSHRRDTADCGGSGRFAACIWIDRGRADKLV